MAKTTKTQRPKKKSSSSIKKKTSNSSKTSSLIRLNKAIAESGVCSRRKADELIENGQVMVNGKKVYELGIRVDPQKDKILVDGKLISAKGKNVYYAFHKPKNVVTTMDDPIGRPTVGDYIKTKERLFPVGRLDWDTEGLLLMTNDGKFAQSVAHPKKEVVKTYMAKLDNHVDATKLKKLLTGVTIIGGRVSAKSVDIVKYGSSKKYEWVKICITEGKNRQVRKMFEKIGYDVLKLKRVAIGGLRLGQLKKGEAKKLTPADIEKIFKQRVEPTPVKTLMKKASAMKKTPNRRKKETRSSKRRSSK